MWGELRGSERRNKLNLRLTASGTAVSLGERELGERKTKTEAEPDEAVRQVLRMRSARSLTSLIVSPSSLPQSHHHSTIIFASLLTLNIFKSGE